MLCCKRPCCPEKKLKQNTSSINTPALAFPLSSPGLATSRTWHHAEQWGWDPGKPSRYVGPKVAPGSARNQAPTDPHFYAPAQDWPGQQSRCSQISEKPLAAQSTQPLLSWAARLPLQPTALKKPRRNLGGGSSPNWTPAHLNPPQSLIPWAPSRYPLAFWASNRHLLLDSFAGL